MNRGSQASAISGGIFLVSLGVLIITGWWWPGIMIAIGLAGGAELIFRGRVAQGVGTLAFFCGVPLVLWIIQGLRIPWRYFGPLILIAIGFTTLIKAFYLRGGTE